MARKVGQHWKQLMHGDDRVVVWLFVCASAGICLTEMFVGR
jgi:hypothetical protein